MSTPEIEAMLERLTAVEAGHALVLQVAKRAEESAQVALHLMHAASAQSKLNLAEILKMTSDHEGRLRKLEAVNPAPDGPGPYAVALARFGAELGQLKEAVIALQARTGAKAGRRGAH